MRINGEPDDQDRFDLPPMPSDLDDFGELLDVARARVDAQRTGDITKRIGAWEPLYLRNGEHDDPELAYLVMEFAKLIVGAIAAIFLLLQFWIVAAVLFAVEAAIFGIHHWWKKRRMEPMWNYRRSIAVRPIAVGLANSRLWEGPLENPEDEFEVGYGGLIVWTDDPERERDPAWLHELVSHVASLPDRPEEETPEPWREVRRFVEGRFRQGKLPGEDGFDAPLQLPAEFVGNDRTFVYSTSLGFAEMPNGYLDRNVLLALQGPGVESGTCILDRYYWWNERADELTRPESYLGAGDDGDAGADAASSDSEATPEADATS